MSADEDRRHGHIILRLAQLEERVDALEGRREVRQRLGVDQRVSSAYPRLHLVTDD